MPIETILLIDDSKVVQSYFNQLINPLDFKLLIANNAKEAREIIDNQKSVNIAIVDLTLPDSIEGEMVEYTLSHQIPTIVLTASHSEELRKKMLSKNIIDYMLKDSKDDFAKVVGLIKQIEENRNTKILIVDDSQTYIMHLRELLKRHQFTVVEAQHGKEALIELEKNPDIKMVLTDYEMPVMDGLKLIKQIRRKHTRYNLPIMVLSAHGDGYKVSDCLRAGANDYLHKPYQSEEFFSRVYMNLLNSENMHNIQEQQAHLQQYKNVIDQTNIVSKTDPKGIITYVNDMFCEISGYTKEELVGATHRVVRHPDTPLETFSSLWETITDKKVWQGVIKNRKKDGTFYLVNTTIMPILDAKENILEYISIRKDITELIEKNRIIEKQYTDTLTKLPNRQKLISELEPMSSAVLVIINIDSFNEINGFYGYDIADKLLIEVANKIKSFIEQTHRLYKLPVDEYALLGQHINEVEEKMYVEDLLKHLSESFMIDDHEIYIHFSVGIYIGDNDHLVNADIALQQAKILKKDICSYEDFPDINSAHHNNLKWSKKLHHAIEEDRIKAFFQPIINNENEQIEKYEALVRMIDEENNVISPYFFLEIAKKTKLYEKLTKIVFNQTLEMAKKIKIPFSVNLTVSDLQNSKLMQYMSDEIQVADASKYIVFELVESEALESQELLSSLEYLKESGIKISIDDFGTGYSNFDYLIKLKANYIKIDGSIVKNVLNDSNSELMIKTIVNVAKELGAKTIAEFVESEEIFNKVKELGVDYSQGYYFSQPLRNILQN
ncbi:EAL domain-containing protein [Sulfurimonas aquatica]|uniref:EAL domain-containing protein n=1 Tax=Sulfurimonas aquatica TaxID=2672570 RepID=A0A975AXX8_9BACT|nr:EAL domain-containing protein [Sulfurimonas aquatica]QSZ40637.1 EAL domain-containing protein [Sulfurimonas aquatica]